MLKSSNIIALVAGNDRSAKEWFSFNMALDFAETGKKTLLCDVDMLSSFFMGKIKLETDLNADLAKALLTQDYPINQAVCHYKNGGFDIIFANTKNENTAKVPASKWRMIKDDVRTLSLSYDKTLLNLGTNIKDDNFPLFAENSGQIILLTDEAPPSLRSAFVLITKLHKKNMSQNLRITITMADTIRQGERAFYSLERAAKDHLGFPLKLAGVVRKNNTDDVNKIAMSLI